MLAQLNFITSHPLNRHRKFGAVWDFARWQLGSRLLPGEVVFDWINGAKFRVRRGETGLTGNVYAGLHEFADMAFLLHFLRPGDMFADVGANAGSYTLLASCAVGARVTAYEPAPATFARLVANVRLNGREDRVRCLNLCAGSEKGTIAFSIGEDTTNHPLATGEAGKSLEVPVERLDDTLTAAPALLKVDVEGFETMVVRGATKTLSDRALQAVIMEFNGGGARYGFDEAALFDQMRGLGFALFSYEPFSRALTPLVSLEQVRGNALLVRDADWVRARLQAAPPFVIRGRSI